MAHKLSFLLHKFICGHLSFQKRVFLLLLVVVVLQLFLVAGFFHQSLSSSLEHQVTSKAMIQAKEIAGDTNFVSLMEQRNVSEIQRYIGRLQRITDADFIVIGDKKGIRLAHPESDKIGKPMVGGDNIKALKYGTSYTTVNKGSLGVSIRGKAGIKSHDGKIIGVVSVGYLLDSVSYWLMFYSYPVIFALIVLMIFSALGAWLFTRHIKQQMFDMEPEEIAMNLHLQHSILQSVYEGTIAVGRKGDILSVNTKALDTLGIPHKPEYLIGRPIQEYVTPSAFFLGANAFGDFSSNVPDVMQDELITCNGETLVANRVNIEDGDEHIGWVVSFRRRNDYNTLTSQISQIRQHNDNLRVMSHEFANRLSVIGGLVQIGAYDQAISTIRKETEQQQQLVDFISQTFHSKVIAGLLLGKYTRAKELGLTLEFDPICHLENDPVSITPDELAAILGNLLDNAFEATLKNPQSNKKVSLLLTYSGEELVMEVADNGTGIPNEISDTLFAKGVTSKNQPGHGIGLYLVHQYVTQAEGTILVDDAEPQGTIFSIFIPNKS
ncbi:sensor histidine kinase [Vibrio tritonius]|uniref:sensor histidine kinase n=1 Tax=Vibrio tritonius TaxID=1435069 RepID=UPI00315DE2F6